MLDFCTRFLFLHVARTLRALWVWLCLFGLSALLGAPAFADALNGPSAHHMKVELVAETNYPAPGKPLTLAIVMTPQPGWHGYWVNPGEAGFAPDFKWTLPKGITASAPQFPVPEKLVVAGLVNHVFSGQHALLVALDIPKMIGVGTKVPVSLKINYLVCSAEICVPESASLDLQLIAGDGTIAPARRVQFDGWRAALPTYIDQPVRMNVSGDLLSIAIPYPATAPDPKQPWLFEQQAGSIVMGTPQRFRRTGDWLVAEIKASPDIKRRWPIIISPPLTSALPIDTPRIFDGLLSLGDGRGLEVYGGDRHDIPEGGTYIGSDAPAPTSLLAVLTALGGALLGGLILNLMPCVFPVIGLKAISLARGGGDEREVRRDALAYAAGVILVCVALGGLMLGLRAAGHAVGWAFQLQDPRVILLLLVLVTAITANLAGVFELQSVSAGDGLTRQKGVAGSFWTGALAAFVATPCTGPFMAAALGAALVLPTFAALMIFAGLGLGLALPFLLLGFIPALRTRLPKPGPWMRRFQQIMAIPMGLTALGLLWLLWRQTGANGLMIGLVVAALGLLALWLIGRNQHEGRKVGLRNLLQWLIPAAVGVALLAQIAPPSEGAKVEAGLLGAEAFSEARLTALQAAHRPVFVYFTADWCLTCKVNEKVAIETQAVADAFKAKHVAVLVGDWTNGDAAISHFLAAHGRSGVPFYLYYPADGGAPKELPQVLTSVLLAGLN